MTLIPITYFTPADKRQPYTQLTCDSCGLYEHVPLVIYAPPAPWIQIALDDDDRLYKAHLCSWCQVEPPDWAELYV